MISGDVDRFHSDEEIDEEIEILLFNLASFKIHD